MLENVRNFERHDKGKTLQTVVGILRKLDYRVFHKVLNASEYGLPQNRARIFIVCLHKNTSVLNFSFPQPSKQICSLQDILEYKPKDAKIINRPDIFMTKSFSPEKDIFGTIKLPNRPIQVGYVNKGGQGERIYSPFGHAITLSAYGGGAGAKTGLYLIDGEIRKLSPRECARLQGFPDSFKIVSSLTQSYKQFGNSVAVNVLKAIIANIFATGVFTDKGSQIVSELSKLSSHH